MESILKVDNVAPRANTPLKLLSQSGIQLSVANDGVKIEKNLIIPTQAPQTLVNGSIWIS